MTRLVDVVRAQNDSVQSAVLQWDVINKCSLLRPGLDCVISQVTGISRLFPASTTYWWKKNTANYLENTCYLAKV